MTVRNDGPDPVAIRQAIVNDGFAAFSQTAGEIGRLGASTVTIDYPWIEGEAYEVALLTATGGTANASIEVAAETPDADLGFFGLMGLVGLYVGVIPVAIGMLWLPWIRRSTRAACSSCWRSRSGCWASSASTPCSEGTEFAGAGSQAFGGAALVYLGALVAYLALVGVDGRLRRTKEREKGDGAGPWRLAFLVALGIGLHNLGEGLAIGSAYAIGSLALGAALIVGFALHNTTEGLAIVAPMAKGEAAAKPSLRPPRGPRPARRAARRAGRLDRGVGVQPQPRRVHVRPRRGRHRPGDRADRAVDPRLRRAGCCIRWPWAAWSAGLVLMYATGLLISL